MSGSQSRLSKTEENALGRNRANGYTSIGDSSQEKSKASVKDNDDTRESADRWHLVPKISQGIEGAQIAVHFFFDVSHFNLRVHKEQVKFSDDNSNSCRLWLYNKSKENIALGTYTLENSYDFGGPRPVTFKRRGYTAMLVHDTKTGFTKSVDIVYRDAIQNWRLVENQHSLLRGRR